MRTTSLFRVFFVLYCMEAGIFLLFVPWSLAWDRVFFHLPAGALRGLGLHPLVRSALSGFGLVHLVWGAHDLKELISRRRIDAAG